MEPRTTKLGLITGEKDGKIIVWNLEHGELIKDKKYDLTVPELKSMMPSVKSICEHPKTGQILVGTRGGEIVEFGNDPRREKAKMHIKSHYHRELKGLTPHPSKP